MFPLDHRDHRPLYEQLQDSIRQQIQADILQPGEQLPSVRELSGILSINPNTIQRSYRELERTGWVVTQPGKGTFVAPRPAPEQSPLWAEFDRAAGTLLDSGHTRAELAARLEIIGGERHA